MAVITKIAVQKKLKDRYNIYTDDGTGEQYAFSVDEAVLIKYQLKKGMELDDFSITEISYHDEIHKAYNQAVHYLASRMRSEHEVRQHLLKKEIEEPVINEVIHKLYQFQFLNDLEFAKSYVRTQRNTTDKGTVLIAQELKEKGISQGNTEEALKEYDSAEELAKAIKLAEKHQLKNKKESTFALKQKLEGLLVRKGYPFGIIQEALGSLDFSKEDDAELEIMKVQGEKFRRKYRNYSGYEFSQKMKQALYRKGFAIELIERYLSELEEMDQ